MTAVTTISPTTERLAGMNGLPDATPMTAMTRMDGSDTILSLAQRAENPMTFLTEMGKQLAYSGMLGLKKPEQGTTMLMLCMTERLTPLAVFQKFHIMEDGKLSIKADWALARFREIGGKYKILRDGSDNESASYEFTYQGNVQTFSYSMDDARMEELVKPKSRWIKNPSSMLRARVITGGVRLVAPEVMAGFYSSEELEGQTDSTPTTTPTTTSTTKKTGKSATASTQTATPSPSSATAEADPTVVDAEFQVTTDDKPPFETAATETPTAVDSARTAALMEIELLWGASGKTMADLVAAISAKFPEVKTVDDMSDERINGILENLRKKAATAKAAEVKASGAVGE